MTKVRILQTWVVSIAIVSMAGCADPEPEVVKASDSASSSERDSATAREPAIRETRPAVVEDRDGRDLAAVDGERSISESRPPVSRDSRSSETSDSRSSGPGMGVGSGIGGGSLPGIRPPGGNDLNDSSSGIGMAVRGNVSGNPGASRQPEADRQPAPREYKLEFTSATGTRGLEVGDTIPEVSGKDLDNIKFKLSDYQGKVVMLDFWGDW